MSSTILRRIPSRAVLGVYPHTHTREGEARLARAVFRFGGDLLLETVTEWQEALGAAAAQEKASAPRFAQMQREYQTEQRYLREWRDVLGDGAEV